MLIMYNNLQNWSHGQTNVAFSSSSAATLPYPSVTVCPYSYNNTAEDIESITRENRLLGLNHVVDNKLNSNLYCQGAFNSLLFINVDDFNIYISHIHDICNNIADFKSMAIIIKHNRVITITIKPNKGDDKYKTFS